MRVFLSNKLRFALLAAPVITLTACNSEFGPWPFPSGYTYHGQTYKAPEGPKPVIKKWNELGAIDYVEPDKNKVEAAPGTTPLRFDTAPAPATETAASAVTNTAQTTPVIPSTTAMDAQWWLKAADDLTSKLLARFGKPAEPVSIQAQNPGTDSADFASALRASLQQQGVKIAEKSGAGSFTLRYDSHSIGDAVEGRLLLTITLSSGGVKAAEQSGVYSLYSINSGNSNSTAEKSSAPTPPATTGAGTSTTAPMPLYKK